MLRSILWDILKKQNYRNISSIGDCLEWERMLWAWGNFHGGDAYPTAQVPHKYTLKIISPNVNCQQKQLQKPTRAIFHSSTAKTLSLMTFFKGARGEMDTLVQEHNLLKLKCINPYSAKNNSYLILICVHTWIYYFVHN